MEGREKEGGVGGGVGGGGGGGGVGLIAVRVVGELVGGDIHSFFTQFIKPL